MQAGQLISSVTSRANRYRVLKKLTDRDSLTGLLNHANILRYLERELSVADRAGRPVSFAMIDIDHFKKVNDTYGHAVGDQVILRMTHLIRDRMRRIDYVGRYGGEEFVLLLPGTVLDAAVTFAERIRECVEKREFTYGDGQTLHRTMSCGVAAWPHPLIADQEALIKAADDALYVAKETGRNRVVRFDSREFNEHISKNGTTDRAS